LRAIVADRTEDPGGAVARVFERTTDGLTLQAPLQSIRR
jgi:hypothetical protein